MMQIFGSDLFRSFSVGFLIGAAALFAVSGLPFDTAAIAAALR